jgi:hypothetical protein
MSKPTDCIPVAEAKTYQANWMAVNEPSSPAPGQPAESVCCVTFNIDQLQQYIDYVKVESANQGILNPGIRVYFAAYNSGTVANVASTTTVFFCPTDGDAKNSANNYNIDPLNKGQNGWPPNAY